jgi:hypothetical protein
VQAGIRAGAYTLHLSEGIRQAMRRDDAAGGRDSKMSCCDITCGYAGEIEIAQAIRSR